MMRKIEWVKYDRQGKLPVERRSVLVMIGQRQSDFQKKAYAEFGRRGLDDPEFKDVAPTVAVGYIRIHSGGPFFVVPGVPHNDGDITHWADCLGDDFVAPLWRCQQTLGKPYRQWDNHLGDIST